MNNDSPASLTVGTLTCVVNDSVKNTYKFVTLLNQSPDLIIVEQGCPDDT